MPRIEIEDLTADALEVGIIDEVTPEPTAEPATSTAEADTLLPPPQAQPESHRRKRSRGRSSHEGRGKQRRSLPENAWQPDFTYKGKPITDDMSIIETPHLASELTGALLLPKDVAAARSFDRKKLTKSALHHYALALQRSYVAFSCLEENERELEAVRLRNAELEHELTKNQEARYVAEVARGDAETARMDAEEEALRLKGQNIDLETALLNRDQTIADKDRAMGEMKLTQQDREDEAYNEGVRSSTTKYKKQILEIRESLFANGWTSALKKAAIPEDSSLYNVESPFKRPLTAPPAPLSTSASHEQHPPSPLE